MPGVGGADRLRLSLVAEGGRTPPQPVPVEALVDGQPIGRVEVGSAAEHVLETARDPAAGDAPRVECLKDMLRFQDKAIVSLLVMLKGEKKG